MMHVVLGDGEMTRRELSKTLEDLLEQAAEQNDDEFWFLLQGKAEPTSTDKGLMDWIAEREIWYAVITDDKKNMDPIYKTAQEVHEVKRLAPKVLSLMQEKPGEGEGAALFGLFVNNDQDVPEDNWLNDVMGSVVEGGFKIFAMNEGLVELEPPGGSDEAEEDEAGEEEPDNVVDLPRGRGRPQQLPGMEDERVEEEAEEPEGDYTRDDLENMDSTRLREIGATKGLEFPPRTRMTTMVNAILGEGEATTEAEVEPVEVPEEDEAPDFEDEPATDETHAQAMLIVVYDGMVISRAVSLEEARELVSL